MQVKAIAAPALQSGHWMPGWCIVPVPGPSALEPGALEQVEQRHGGLTDIHEGRLNVALQAQGAGASRFSGLRGPDRTWRASGCLEPFALRAAFRWK
ncbi:hypothetical protein EYF80_015905 [Liparis tanakae]|uniref:Uncharacterized protein n=1 Tax=Liparis tanakae TaxID=230148 RepID=A0A4Z2I7G2_9TELE|nr:hypothetical protein EYF80_015905 [Liparis tanakae]